MFDLFLALSVCAIGLWFANRSALVVSERAFKDALFVDLLFAMPFIVFCWSASNLLLRWVS